MDKRYSSVNKNHKKESTISNTSRLSIGGQSIILGKNFNILKILNNIEQKTTEKEVLHKPNILPLLYPQTPKKKIKYFNSSFDKNNISTLKNEHSSKKNKECFITSIEDEQPKNSGCLTDKKIYKYSLKYMNSNKQKRLYDDKKINNNNIHLSAIIKEIRKKNISNNGKNNFNNDIAYDKKNMDCIIDMNEVLNKHCNNNDWDLKEKENNYNDFVTNNKEMKLQNVLIKLMNREKNKIDNNHNMYAKSLEIKKKSIDEDEENFNQIKKEQKYYNRLIEDNLVKLKSQNKILLYIRENINEALRKTEFEIMKKIYEIDELRIYAKFVKHIYGYDTSKYETSFIEKDSNKGQSNIEELVKNVIENYKECLDEGDNETDNIEPDIIFNEITLIEDRILFVLKEKDKELEELKKIQKNNELILKEIINKKNGLEEEYNYLKEECNYILNLYSNENKEKDLFIIAQDLFNYIIDELSNDNRYYNKYKDKNNSTIYNPFEISGLGDKSIKLVLDKEATLNKYIQMIEKYENEDPKTFNEIINTRKNQIILEKLQAAKQRIQNSEMIERMNIEKKSDKIYFIKRKMHQSIPKKKKIKIKIDPKVIKRLEDVELLNYQ